MKNAIRIACALLMALAVAAPALAGQGNTRPDAIAPVTIQGPTVIKVHYLGYVLTLPCVATSSSDEFMVRADAPQLRAIAQAFGKTLTWSRRTQTLTEPGGPSLKMGQTRFPDTSDGVVLNPPPTVIGGAVHVPLSCLEEFLGTRVTVEGKVAYVEPLIRSVQVKGKGRDLKLVIHATAPVRYKTFTLKKPSRYVIDVAGAVLDTSSLKIYRPRLGTVRLGQFELGPAVSRIVIPTRAGVEVRGPGPGRARKIAFSLRVPSTGGPGQNYAQQKVTRVTVEPIVGGQMIELTTTGPVQYHWHRLHPPDNRLFLDIPNAIFVNKKKTVTVHDPYLGTVRVAQFEPKPNPVVRLVLDLKKPATTRIRTAVDHHSLVVEVHHDTIDLAYAEWQGYGITGHPENGPTICIDPGHGGSDPGCINRRLHLDEKTCTLAIGLDLARILRARGWNVVMTRTTDRDVSWPFSPDKVELGDRCKIANDMHADVFVSIHCNASVDPYLAGTRIHYYSQGGKVLAESMENAVMRGIGCPDLGIQRNRFYVLMHTNMPSVLIETAFLSNMREARMLETSKFRLRVAEAIASGLNAYAMEHLGWVAAYR